MDAETRAFAAVNVLALGLLGLVAAARWLGTLSAWAAGAGLLFVALGLLYLLLDDTAADKAVGAWLRQPFRGPAGWTRPKRRA